MEPERVRDIVKEEYRRAVVRAGGGGTSCCGSTAGQYDPITADLYAPDQVGELPGGALAASFGCGNPTALAALRPGEVVPDLGSGAGLDVLLSAKRVGPTGKAYGLDMTEEMLELAREHQRTAGLPNVEFLEGEIEAVPLPDRSVDVIISNCVINLSGDKARVFAEAFRLLKPGGRLAIADIVRRGEVPAALRRSMELWAGCVAGALEEREYRTLLARAGFGEISLEPTRIYTAAEARDFLRGSGLDAEAVAPQIDGKFMSAFVRATRPGDGVTP